jgi:hypothetical protein
MCTSARPYGRVERCVFGGRGDACGPEMGHMAWHMGRHWTYGHMHVRVGLGWGTRHGVWVGTGRVSWTDEDVGFLGGGECHTRPNLDGS